jgi:hypothetical protein
MPHPKLRGNPPGRIVLGAIAMAATKANIRIAGGRVQTLDVVSTGGSRWMILKWSNPANGNKRAVKGLCLDLFLHEPSSKPDTVNVMEELPSATVSGIGPLPDEDRYHLALPVILVPVPPKR